MHAFTLREAAHDDWLTIAEFNCRLAEETESKRLDRTTVESGVQAILGDSSKGRYFVAVAEGSIVGQMMHTLEWSDWRNGNIWWIQSVYVSEEYRQRGVFKALYQHLRQLAEAADDVVGIRLYVENDNSKAQAVYQRLGMASVGYRVMEEMFQ